MHAAALIPVKSFRAAKARLADVLTEAERAHLARSMAVHVVRAAQPMSVHIACDDDEVATFATEVGAEVLWCPGLGLNAAVDAGVSALSEAGFDHVVVAHGDLPLADDLRRVVRDGEIVLVPDRRRDGTNVLSRPCAVEFSASYGPGSFAAHHRAALATGVPVTVLVDRSLAIDIDTVDDCRHPLVAKAINDFLERT